MGLSDRIKTGATHEPLRVFLHGVEGIGKTTFAAGAPGVVFIGPEDGAGDLKLDRIVVSTWAEFVSAIQDLTYDEHGYATLAIDTVDFLERLLHQHITKGKTSLELVEGGYGKGYKMAAEQMTQVIQAIDVLRSKRRMNVIALAHTDVKKFDDPTEASYDRYQPRLHKEVAGLWLGWSDCVLFANYDIKVRVANGGSTPTELRKGKAVDKPPDRVLYTERRPAYDAKNRQGLPPEIPLSWEEFAKEIRWDERDAAQRGKREEAPKPREATPEEIGREMSAAKGRGWTSDDLKAAFDSFDLGKCKTLADIPAAKRAGLLRLLKGEPLPAPHNNTRSNQQEAQAK